MFALAWMSAELSVRRLLTTVLRRYGFADWRWETVEGGENPCVDEKGNAGVVVTQRSYDENSLLFSARPDATHRDSCDRP